MSTRPELPPPGPVTTADSDTVRALATALVANARRTVDIISRHLDPPIYDQAPMIEAMKRLVLASRHSRVRILVIDPAPLVHGGHRLVTLAQRLSSQVAIRVPGPADADLNRADLVVDERAYIHRPLSDRYDGVADSDDPRTARDMARRFDALWAQAVPDPNLRPLHL